MRTQGFLERLGDEVISGIELIRSKAMSLVGMAGGSSGGGSGSSSRSGFEANRIMEKQGYYDAGSDLEASGSAVSSKGMYRASHVLVDLGWVDLDLGFTTILLVQ